MQFDGTRRRHAFAARDLVEAGPQRADICALAAEQVPALRYQPRDRRLAIGARHSDDAHVLGRKVVIAVCDYAELFCQSGYRNHRHADVGRWLTGRIRVECDCSNTGADRLVQIIEPVTAFARAGQEQKASLEQPAV